jgi:hypothetical protein
VTESCDLCRFYFRVGTVTEDDRRSFREDHARDRTISDRLRAFVEVGATYGECHRRAPVLISPGSRFGFPAVFGREWCGEFEPGSVGR